MTSSTDPSWSLAEMEDWMRLAVATPQGLAGGLRRARERYGERHPLKTPNGAGHTCLAERLAIYTRGYLTRLLSCLRADYPVLCALVGDTLFEQFVIGYLEAHPPRHYSLFELGAAFPDHLERTRPRNDAVPETWRALLSLPVDVARLERARLEASRAPVAASVPARADLPFGLEALSRECTLRAAACVRLLTLSHDIRSLVAAIDEFSRSCKRPHAGVTVPLPRPQARPLLLAVSVVRYQPVFSELAPWQHHLLASARNWAPLSEIVRATAAAMSSAEGEVLADLSLWLPTAEALGLIEIE